MKITIDISESALLSNDQVTIMSAVNEVVSKNHCMITSRAATSSEIRKAIIACGAKFGSFTNTDVARELGCTYCDNSRYRGGSHNYRIVDVSAAIAEALNDGIIVSRSSGFCGGVNLYSIAK